MEFDQYTDSYRDAVEESIAFAGGDAARYVGAKARMLVELARRHLGDPAGLEALDLGCGPRETDAFLEGRFARLHGVDLSGPMVRRAAKRNRWAEYSPMRMGIRFRSRMGPWTSHSRSASSITSRSTPARRSSRR